MLALQNIREEKAREARYLIQTPETRHEQVRGGKKKSYYRCKTKLRPRAVSAAPAEGDATAAAKKALKYLSCCSRALVRAVSLSDLRVSPPCMMPMSWCL